MPARAGSNLKQDKETKRDQGTILVHFWRRLHLECETVEQIMAVSTDAPVPMLKAFHPANKLSGQFSETPLLLSLLLPTLAKGR